MDVTRNSQTDANHEKIISEVIMDELNDLLNRNPKLQGVAVYRKNGAIELNVISGSVDDVNYKSIFQGNWIEAERILSKCGWIVAYAQIAQNEAYSATLTFSPTN